MSFRIYETVTNRIIAELEAGAIPWTQPWKNQKSGGVMPLNRATGRPYSGINIPILWGAASAFGYPTHQWQSSLGWRREAPQPRPQEPLRHQGVCCRGTDSVILTVCTDSSLLGGRVVQVPRPTPRDHRAGGGGRGRCLWTHLGNPFGRHLREFGRGLRRCGQRCGNPSKDHHAFGATCNRPRVGGRSSLCAPRADNARGRRAQVRSSAGPGVERPAGAGHGPGRRVRLERLRLPQPFAGRQGDHRHELEWASLLRAEGGSRSEGWPGAYWRGSFIFHTHSQSLDPRPHASRVRAPAVLDASQSPWPIASADGTICINMVHISRWEATLAGSSRTPLVTPFRAPRILLVVIGRRSASASASPSRGPGNGILRAETAGEFRRRTRENGRNSIRRPRLVSLTNRNCEGFCVPGNRVGLPFADNLAKFSATWHYASENRIFALYIGVCDEAARTRKTAEGRERLARAPSRRAQPREDARRNHRHRQGQ